MTARPVLALVGIACIAMLVGQITVDADPGKDGRFNKTGAQDVLGGTIGPDVMVWKLYDPENWGTEGDIRAYSIGTISCNVGDEELSWRDSGPFSNRHPVIGANMFRLKEGHFEQIGQSWLKHGFCALDGNACGNCQSNGSCDWLGVGCSDPYNGWLNGQHYYLGPKSQVNPYTGEFPFPHPTPPDGTVSGRLQVHLPDVLPDQNPDAIYWVESHYVTPDDAEAGNGYNNVSHRGVNLLADGQIGSFAGTTVQELAALYAWQAVDPQVAITPIDLPLDGRLFLGYKVTDLGNGYWEYQYALYNMNSDRAAGSIFVPVDDAVEVLNDGFHDVDYHSGEPFVGTDWAMSRSAGRMVWQTESFESNPDANAVRWGTLYNFRFEADAPPAEAEIEIGLFKPGWPTSIIVTAIGPSLDDATTATPNGFYAFRGFHLSGDLTDVLASDDSDLCYEPGIVLLPSEAPVTLDFFGTLPNDSPSSLDVTIESSANTVGLDLTFSFWNFSTDMWDVVGTDTQSLNDDTVRTFAGIPAAHIEPGTGEVRTRYEVRVVSFIFLYPWLDCVDHVFWTISN